MQYNFDEVIDRSNTGSIKWHYADDTIPLWVADMDFKAAQPILDNTACCGSRYLRYTNKAMTYIRLLLTGTVAAMVYSWKRSKFCFHLGWYPVFL